MSNHELSVLFFLQLTIILAAVRLAGTLARKAGQPRVVGEMIAGILIGPTLLGRMFPTACPADSGAIKADHLRRLPDWDCALYVHRRSGVSDRSGSSKAAQRNFDFSFRHHHSVRAGLRVGDLPDAQPGTLSDAYSAVAGDDVHGRGDGDHCLSDARSHHIRTPVDRH